MIRPALTIRLCFAGYLASAAASAFCFSVSVMPIFSSVTRLSVPVTRATDSATRASG